MFHRVFTLRASHPALAGFDQPEFDEKTPEVKLR